MIGKSLSYANRMSRKSGARVLFAAGAFDVTD
jgi:hypothetical protein